MGTKITYPFIIVAAIVEVITLRAWFICKSFVDYFHLSSYNIPLQILGDEHADKGTPLFLTRLFTNKPVTTILDIVRVYLQFWDIRFGVSWFSLIGYFGIGAGLYYIFLNKHKRYYHWLMLFVILLLPLIEILIEPHISILIKSIYLWLPCMLFSLYGLYQFVTHGFIKKRLVILGILLLLSIWWIAFLPYTLPRYCMQ